MDLAGRKKIYEEIMALDKQIDQDQQIIKTVKDKETRGKMMEDVIAFKQQIATIYSVTKRDVQERLDNFTLAESDVELVGVEDVVATPFGFAPNPTTGSLNVTGVMEAQDLVVLDLMGREVLRVAVEVGQQSVAVDVPDGVYLFGPESGRGLRKLVVRH